MEKIPSQNNDPEETGAQETDWEADRIEAEKRKGLPLSEVAKSLGLSENATEDEIMNKVREQSGKTVSHTELRAKRRKNAA